MVDRVNKANFTQADIDTITKFIENMEDVRDTLIEIRQQVHD
jgi:hypothetical protein